MTKNEKLTVRAFYGLTQEIVAQECGVSLKTVYRYENGESFNPVLEKYYKAMHNAMITILQRRDMLW